MLAGGQGTLNLPPGSGKTFVALLAVARLGRSALILVHTKDLLEQWRQEVKLRLGLVAGIFGAGRQELQQITIATTQALARLTDWELYRLSGQFGISIYDEVHSVPARTFFRVQNLLCCRYRWGLSATPEREDGLQRAIALVVGPELYKQGYPDLVAQGYLLQPRIFAVSTGFKPTPQALAASNNAQEQRRASARLDRELISSAQRNQLIVRLVAAGLLRGQTVLVLTCRVAHANALASLLHTAGYEALPLTGRLPTLVRRAIFRRFRERKLRCVIATQLADYGLDVPHIERTIAAFPIRARGRTAQRTGRGLRLYLSKTSAEFFDLVDDLVPMLARRFAVRRAVYWQSFGIVPESYSTL